MTSFSSKICCNILRQSPKIQEGDSWNLIYHVDECNSSKTLTKTKHLLTIILIRYFFRFSQGIFFVDVYNSLYIMILVSRQSKNSYVIFVHNPHVSLIKLLSQSRDFPLNNYKLRIFLLNEMPFEQVLGLWFINNNKFLESFVCRFRFRFLSIQDRWV